MPAHRRAALAAVLLLFGATTGCSLLAVPADRAAQGPPATVRPVKQVLLAAAQHLDDLGGARIEVVEEGPAGRRAAGGTLSWGQADAGELTVTDERGAVSRLTVRDGVAELTPDGGVPRRAGRADAESLDPRGTGTPEGYAGGWMTSLVGNPGRPAHTMALAGRLTPLGGEQLAGTTVAHYRASAPVATYFTAEPGLSDERLAAVLAHYQRRGVVSVEYDFWVAPGDRLLRLRSTATGPDGTTVTTTDVSEPGAVTPPPTTSG
ncbi:hypothetical protein ACWEQL_13635 [Kitasatospora sp. NPDC004240]